MVAHPITRLLHRRTLCVLGMNTGTSVDGVDAALVRIRDSRCPRITVLETASRPLPRRLQRTLKDLAEQEAPPKPTAVSAHFELGEFLADSATRWSRLFHRRGHRVDLVASHGQTIAHYPHQSHRATWQIGALNTIAQRTGLVTVGDFRPADIAAGGMGAPLSGYYHHLLFGTGTAVLNIGGIANISVSRIRRSVLEVVAFDTGPGNMISDALASHYLGQSFDRHGRRAARGQVIQSIVRDILAHSYFRLRPPKTCGREEFGWRKSRALFTGRHQVDDLLATGVEITAQSIARSLTRWITDWSRERSLVITGGGAANRALMTRLHALLDDWKFHDAEDWGIPSRYVEPTGFAVLAHETLRGRPGNLGGATGNMQPAVLGLIALPPPLA